MWKNQEQQIIQTTSGIKKIIDNDGNKDDLLAFFQERMLPVD